MASWEEFSRIVAEAKAAKKLDPPGKEDDDVNNDNKVDSTDDYLKNRRSAVGAAIAADKKKKSGKDSDEMCEAKVDEKLPEHERATARDKRSGHNLPGSGTRRVRRAEHEDRRGKPKRWWDNDGDGIGWEKGEVKKEEVERIDEIAPLIAGGLALGGALAAGAAIKRAQDAAKSGVDAANKGKQIKNPGTGIGGAAYGMQRHNNALKDAMKQLNQSHELEGEMVEEDKEYRREMRKVAARERAEEKSGRKEEGKRAAKAPGRLGPSAGKSYADKEELSIKGHDEVTKKSKHTHGNPFPEQVEFSGQQLDEKALSRAQQRFMGMVYAAKKGETPASPEVAKAASGMSKKAARDFAKTKHEGLPEKKEDTKEELSLVDRIIAEAISGTISGGTSRAKKYKIQAKDVRIKQIGSAALSGDKKLVKKLKKANENPTLKITEKGSVPKKSEEERKETAKKEVKRGKSDPSANVRSGIVRGVIELKKEKEKTKRQRERQQYDKEKRAEKKAERQKEFESSYKEKRIKAAQRQSDREEARKEKTKKEIKSAVKQGIGSIRTGYTSDKDSAGKAADQALSNVGKVAGGILKTGKGIISAKMKERKEKKQEEKRSERHAKIRQEMSKEEFSNWREEFIFEVDDQSVKNEKQKVIDVSKKKNKIEINPNMSEGCGCDEKEKTEKPQKDMRDLPTKVNLAKTKARSAGVRNPIVMVATEGAAWTKKEGKSEAGGLNEKGRKSYERENPGSDLKAPSKKVGNPRRASFCSRMKGMKEKLTSAKTANDPDSRINKSLRAWNC